MKNTHLTELTEEIHTTRKEYSYACRICREEKTSRRANAMKCYKLAMQEALLIGFYRGLGGKSTFTVKTDESTFFAAIAEGLVNMIRQYKEGVEPTNEVMTAWLGVHITDMTRVVEHDCNVTCKIVFKLRTWQNRASLVVGNLAGTNNRCFETEVPYGRYYGLAELFVALAYGVYWTTYKADGVCTFEIMSKAMLPMINNFL